MQASWRVITLEQSTIPSYLPTNPDGPENCASIHHHVKPTNFSSPIRPAQHHGPPHHPRLHPQPDPPPPPRARPPNQRALQPPPPSPTRPTAPPRNNSSSLSARITTTHFGTFFNAPACLINLPQRRRGGGGSASGARVLRLSSAMLMRRRLQTMMIATMVMKGEGGGRWCGASTPRAYPDRGAEAWDQKVYGACCRGGGDGGVGMGKTFVREGLHLVHRRRSSR